MTNPFKFGTVVTGSFFTNRKEEILKARQIINSENHLVIISPRRFGKTSLIYKLLEGEKRHSIIMDLQLVTGGDDLGAQLLKKLYRIYPFEKLKMMIRKFRVTPSITLNPMSNEVDVTFQAGEKEEIILEDVLNLINDAGSRKDKLIVVLDEFQEIKKFGKDIDKQLRGIMQKHENVNYIFIGSQESLMREIFEKKRSPFYHFGYLMLLEKIPAYEFKKYLVKRFVDMGIDEENLAEEILKITGSHPYYTQLLAFNAWEMVKKKEVHRTVEKAVEEIVVSHDMDFERLWNTINITDKKILLGMALSGYSPMSLEFSRKYIQGASSTIYSGLKRLMKDGHVIRTESGFEIDDPFFRRWIGMRRER